MPQAAAPTGSCLEPQTNLPRVQAHATEPAARRQAPSAQARTVAAVRAEAAGQRLVGGLHERCADLRPALPAINIVDDFNREALHIEVDTSINSERLIRVFDHLRRQRGLPQILRTDNGPEFLGEAFTQWAKNAGMAIQYIQPGKPNQNAYIERFNRTLRNELLDQHLFVRLEDVREAAYWWRLEYNEVRPHDSLGDRRRPSTPKPPETLVMDCRLDGKLTIVSDPHDEATPLICSRLQRRLILAAAIKPEKYQKR